MLKIFWKIYFYVKCMIRFSSVSTEQQVQKVKISGTMLKSSQVNALILIFYMGLEICHENLLTYVACGEGHRYFSQIVFLYTRFYKNIAGLVLKDTLGERKCIF